MIGDRMDTDIVSGLEAGLETILVLTGISTRESAERYPYRPARIVDSVADLAAAARVELPPPRSSWCRGCPDRAAGANTRDAADRPARRRRSRGRVRAGGHRHGRAPDLEHALTELSETLGTWTYLLVGGLAFLETGAFVGLIAPGETAIVLGGVVAAQGEIASSPSC